MAEITAALVKELREKTGAGMLDCKKALAENNGDIEASIDWLRKKGLASAAKKAGRVAAEGVVAVAGKGNAGAILEVNSETDFVGRNEQFQKYAQDVVAIALAKGSNDIEALKAEAMADGKSVQDTITTLIATIGENMSLRRVATLSVGQGIVASYVHNAVATGLGKIGVLVALESTGDAAKLQELGKQLAMHIAAAKPEALTVADLDQDKVARERNFVEDQTKASGKPAEIIAKMVEGRMRKYYEEVVLLEQTYVMDGERKISAVVEQAAKDVGAPVKLAAFVRYTLGEGIEKVETDFAAEVAAQAKIAS
jgi:elongation factor Ts